LWRRIQARTSRLRCQEALSQISSSASFPSACNSVQHQASTGGRNTTGDEGEPVRMQHLVG
jgi:hypothetical protein